MQEKAPSVERKLPDFENPPAVETVMGVHFAPITGLQSPYFGLYWARIRGDYPRFEIQPPLMPAAGPDHLISQLRSPVDFPLRSWFFNQDETRLIQVQNNAFLHNWRKTADGNRYLHYDDLRPHFERGWQEFRRFLEDEGLGLPTVSICEVTYVNHIDRGSGWETFADLSRVFPNWSAETSGGVLPSPELVALNTSYPISGTNGHLQIVAQPVVRQHDTKETIQLTVTARCKPSSSLDKDICVCLDEARSWVVKGFTDFTSQEMHKMWGRKI